MFKVLNECQPLPDKLLPKIILDIIVSINRYASEQGINIDSFFNKNFTMKEVLQTRATMMPLTISRTYYRQFVNILRKRERKMKN